MDTVGRDGGGGVRDSGERGDLGPNGRFRQAVEGLKLEASNSDFIGRYWRVAGSFSKKSLM